MSNQKRRKVKMKRPPVKKKSWLEVHYMKVIVGLVVLFLFFNFRSCMQKTTLKRENAELVTEYDSLINVKNGQIQDLSELLDEANDVIQEQSYELKIAGVKAEEADKRAAAIQRTAEKIKANTTIEIKTDTTRNKIN